MVDEESLNIFNYLYIFVFILLCVIDSPHPPLTRFPLPAGECLGVNPPYRYSGYVCRRPTIRSDEGVAPYKVTGTSTVGESIALPLNILKPHGRAINDRPYRIEVNLTVKKGLRNRSPFNIRYLS